jgi:MoxR-like ATPase
MADDVAKNVSQIIAKLQDNMATVVKGKPHAIRGCLVALISGEHILLEDVPGVGKTLIGKSLAKSIDAGFCRLQFTPDLLPSDIVGSSVFRPNTGDFEFLKGPIFSSVVLADEINRAPPRTQSALLEAMSDEQVSVDGATYDLPNPFIVIATQNPFEFSGTYELPESQMDRFLMRISMGYPDRHQELEVLFSHRDGEPVDHLKSVIRPDEISILKNAARKIPVHDLIANYLLDVVDRTRNANELSVGVSTRGALLWYRAAQSLALIEGSQFVTPDHVKSLSVSVLSHRVTVAGFTGENQRSEVETIIERLVADVAVPA